MKRLVWIPVHRPRAPVPQTDASNCEIAVATTRKHRYGYYNGYYSDYGYPSYYGRYGWYGGYPWYYNGYLEQRYPYV